MSVCVCVVCGRGFMFFLCVCVCAQVVRASVWEAAERACVASLHCRDFLCVWGDIS